MTKFMEYLLGGIVVVAILFTVGYFIVPMVWNSFNTGAHTNIISDTASTTPDTSTTTMDVTASGVKSTTPVTQPSLPQTTAPVATTTLPVGTEQFTIELGATSSDAVLTSLSTDGFISTQADQGTFTALATQGNLSFAAGAYKLSATMTPAEIVTVLKGAPYMKWVVIPEGLRKEEIANLLAKALGWSASDKQQFIDATNVNSDDIEGVYFPDTYLIPVAEAPADTANRLIAKFNEEFAPFLPQFSAQNIKWTTGLTLASIVQREASGDSDMPLIAGILWNRLDQGMPLDVDATLQYARGDVGNGYWAPISVADKKIDSPYNTYTNKGLPPHPISNPGLAAIEAVLQPASTTCIYYIHDTHQVTHCAATYAEQEANIQEYLIGTSTASTTTN